MEACLFTEILKEVFIMAAAKTTATPKNSSTDTTKQSLRDAAIAKAKKVRTDTNPEGSWPFPIYQRPS